MTQIMGILNVTPDSFSDGGRFETIEAAVSRALAMMDAGANIIDIGGESTRPGADQISVDEELSRVIPVIAALRDVSRERDSDIVISIDTRKAQVAKTAIYAGADIWNDVTALGFEDSSRDVAAQLACPVILMHAQGQPETMQDDPQYGEVVSDICQSLETSAKLAIEAGVDPDDITLDPGIGFGKRLEDNLAILAGLPQIKALGYGVLIGASRKSFIGHIDGSRADDRLGGSLAAALWSVQRGADIVRVHDVAQTVQALKIWTALSDARSPHA